MKEARASSLLKPFKSGQAHTQSRMISSLIEEIEIILTILALVMVVFILYKFYRKVRIARMGPPKSRMVYSGKAATEDKPKTSQVIGMIKCDYCGALMPQTATSYPNCGASRKN